MQIHGNHRHVSTYAVFVGRLRTTPAPLAWLGLGRTVLRAELQPHESPGNCSGTQANLLVGVRSGSTRRGGTNCHHGTFGSSPLTVPSGQSHRKRPKTESLWCNLLQLGYTSEFFYFPRSMRADTPARSSICFARSLISAVMRHQNELFGRIRPPVFAQQVDPAEQRNAAFEGARSTSTSSSRAAWPASSGRPRRLHEARFACASGITPDAGNGKSRGDDTYLEMPRDDAAGFASGFYDSSCRCPRPRLSCVRGVRVGVRGRWAFAFH